MQDFLSYLNQFGEIARETTGGYFAITRLRDGKWQLSFTNIGKVFRDRDLINVISNTRKFILENRTVVETEIKYTLYKRY